MTINTYNQRDTFLDSLKFMLIFLVVLGHMLGGGYVENNQLNLAVRNFIYLFHMPLFVFISGYFSKNLEKEKFRTGILKILETFLTLQILSLLPAILDGTINLGDIITPWWILWYLFSLIFWRLFVFFTNPISATNRVALIISSFAISVLIGFVPFIGYPFSLSRTFVFLPFFLLGFYADRNYITKIRSIPKYLTGSFLILVFVALLYFNIGLHVIVSGAFSYYTLGSVYFEFMGRVVFIIMSILMSIAFINIAPDVKLFRAEGKNTLLYYSYHGFFVLAFNYIVLKYNLSHNFIVILLATTTTLILIHFLSKFEISKIILNPYSTLLQHFSKKSSSLNSSD